jgi:predicted RND superfamily exporter protein
MGLAVFVMYVILAILYESYVHPLTVLSTLPTALVGGLLTLFVFGQEASLYAFVGMFMLMGIVKKNGIMIVDFARARVDAGEAADKAIHDASMDRFRPILMTTLAAVFGALPIALGYGADGSSRRPLGLVVVGGLVVSQFITLFITPVIYLYLEQFQEQVLDRSKFWGARHHETRPITSSAEETEALTQRSLLQYHHCLCSIGSSGSFACATAATNTSRQHASIVCFLIRHSSRYIRSGLRLRSCATVRTPSSSKSSRIAGPTETRSFS